MLKDTCATDNFCQMLSYFVQTQSIGDNQTRSTPSFTPTNIRSTGGRFSQGRSGRGQFGKSSSLSYGDHQNLYIPCKIDTSHCGVYLDYRGPCPVHPTLTHTSGDCFNNPKNNNTSGRNINNRNRGGRTGRRSYYYNQGGWRFGQGYSNHCQLTSIPTLYLQQDPATNTSADVLSTVTNTDTSSTIPKQTYIVKPININRGEKNSCELYDNVNFCDTDMKICIINCDTVVLETKSLNSTLLHTDSHSHHFHSLYTIFPQDGDQNAVLPYKNNMFYAFDTIYVQEVDNFQICINKLNNQHTDVNIIQQDLLPISLLVPIYIQNIPNHKVLKALFDSGGTISLIHEWILLPNIVPLIGLTQNFTTLAREFQSNRQVLLEKIVLPEFKHTTYIDNQQCQVFSGPCLCWPTSER